MHQDFIPRMTQAGIELPSSPAKGLRDRNSPTCTLSQNGYGDYVVEIAATLTNKSVFSLSSETQAAKNDCKAFSLITQSKNQGSPKHGALRRNTAPPPKTNKMKKIYNSFLLEVNGVLACVYMCLLTCVRCVYCARAMVQDIGASLMSRDVDSSKKNGKRVLSTSRTCT